MSRPPVTTRGRPVTRVAAPTDMGSGIDRTKSRSVSRSDADIPRNPLQRQTTQPSTNAVRARSRPASRAAVGAPQQGVSQRPRQEAPQPAGATQEGPRSTAPANRGRPWEIPPSSQATPPLTQPWHETQAPGQPGRPVSTTRQGPGGGTAAIPRTAPSRGDAQRRLETEASMTPGSSGYGYASFPGDSRVLDPYGIGSGIPRSQNQTQASTYPGDSRGGYGPNPYDPRGGASQLQQETPTYAPRPYASTFGLTQFGGQAQQPRREAQRPIPVGGSLGDATEGPGSRAQAPLSQMEEEHLAQIEAREIQYRALANAQRDFRQSGARQSVEDQSRMTQSSEEYLQHVEARKEKAAMYRALPASKEKAKRRKAAYEALYKDEIRECKKIYNAQVAVKARTEETRKARRAKAKAENQDGEVEKGRPGFPKGGPPPPPPPPPPSAPTV
ncbi:hypothetical protein LTR53_001261 [Teratosphaeriaceae sp. CCFEE 6253]|nr:hypothetical protein LTR53_001261 [Teratosphaeriaceae sp. CCFEE 6253]